MGDCDFSLVISNKKSCPSAPYTALAVKEKEFLAFASVCESKPAEE